MKNYKSPEMIEAYKNSGYRERYAMEHGNKTIIYVDGRKCFMFIYSKKKEYQDVNGATYDTVKKSWID